MEIIDLYDKDAVRKFIRKHLGPCQIRFQKNWTSITLKGDIGLGIIFFPYIANTPVDWSLTFMNANTARLKLYYAATGL